MELFPGMILAAKMVDLRHVQNQWTDRHLRNEMKLVQRLKHTNIMSAVKVIKTTHHAFIFMPLAVNATIQDYMCKVIFGPIHEVNALAWFFALMAGVHYLHTNQIVHRDLKLENFLLDADFKPLITDFGFASIDRPKVKSSEPAISFLRKMITNRVDTVVLCHTVCGTAEYVAPEVQLLTNGGTYSAKPVDIYAMGASLFEMVNFAKPFRGGPFKIGCEKLITQQMLSDFAYNSRVCISEPCKQIIGDMLSPNPKSRPTAKMVMDLASLISFDKLSDTLTTNNTESYSQTIKPEDD